MIKKVCCFCFVIPAIIAAIALSITGVYLNKHANRDGYMGPEYYVSDAIVNTFSMSPNKTLEYDLNMTIFVENTFYLNTKIKWSKLETIPVYENQELGKVDLGGFQLERIAEKELKVEYKGIKNITANVDPSKVNDMKLVDIVLNIEANRTGNTLWGFKVKNDFKFECRVKVPTLSGGEMFEEKKCVRKKDSQGK